MGWIDDDLEEAKRGAVVLRREKKPAYAAFL
jgi:hypothetical protein